jgi:hypothetical protein
MIRQANLKSRLIVGEYENINENLILLTIVLNARKPMWYSLDSVFEDD